MFTLKRGKNMEEIEPKEAFTEIEKHRDDPDLVILDVRTPEEYEFGHLENAHNMDVTSKDFEESLENLDKNKKYFVYCKAGKRGCKAADIMKKHGFKEVFNITGGIDKWRAKRLPVAID